MSKDFAKILQEENQKLKEPKNPEKKMQKKVYLTEKTSWYLSMLQNKTGQPNGEIVEQLITEEYYKKNQKGDKYNELHHTTKPRTHK